MNGGVYIHRLLLEIVRAPLAELDLETNQSVQTTTTLPADLSDRVPLVYLRAVAPSTQDSRGLFRAPVTVDVYGAGENQAQRISDAVWRLFFDAWHQQTTYPSGHVASCSNPVYPFDASETGVPDGVSRYTAEYVLGLRPPAS